MEILFREEWIFCMGFYLLELLEKFKFLPCVSVFYFWSAAVLCVRTTPVEAASRAVLFTSQKVPDTLTLRSALSLQRCYIEFTEVLLFMVLEGKTFRNAVIRSLEVFGTCCKSRGHPPWLNRLFQGLAQCWCHPLKVCLFHPRSSCVSVLKWLAFFRRAQLSLKAR